MSAPTPAREWASGISVLDKASTLLEIVEQAPTPLNELVARSGLARPTAYRIAMALQRLGLLTRDSRKRFVLGPRLGSMSVEARHDRLAQEAVPVLAELHALTGLDARVLRRSGRAQLCVATSDDAPALREDAPASLDDATSLGDSAAPADGTSALADALATGSDAPAGRPARTGGTTRTARTPRPGRAVAAEPTRTTFQPSATPPAVAMSPTAATDRAFPAARTGPGAGTRPTAGPYRPVASAGADPTDRADRAPVGTARALTGGAVALVLLAWEEPEEIFAGLRGARFTAAHLSQVRRRGWARGADAMVPGEVAYAVPVRIGAGRVVAALSVSGEPDRMDPVAFRRFGAPVFDAANRLGDLLQQSHPAPVRD